MAKQASGPGNGLRNGGRCLVESLVAHGVDTVFGVPGESYLEALDALYDHRNSLRYITCRQEGGAAFMAEAHGKLTGRPGICFVTRGPGVSNASIGVHTAFQNSTPFVLLIGQVPRGFQEREAFQEIDYRRMLGPMTKWVAQVDDAERLPEFVNRAFATAMAGRPGPVALALPEDMLRDDVSVPVIDPVPPVQSHPGVADLARLRSLLERAQRPLVLLGGSVWTPRAYEAIHSFAVRNDLPVAVGFRRQDLFDNSHACYAGDVAYGITAELKSSVEQADLLLVIGSRLGEGTSIKYGLIAPEESERTLVHIYPSGEELGRLYAADLAIQAGVEPAALALAEMAPISDPPWRAWRQEVRDGYLKSLEVGPQPGDLDMGQVMAHLRDRLPANAIVTNGAGNYADWPNKLYQYRGLGTLLGPVSGAMGYSVPAAVAAKITHPDRVVIGFAGDGDFLMNGQELATAAQNGVNPIILVVNNDMYGTIRMHQEIKHPGRVSGTDLRNPDFATFAKAFGGYGELVTRTEDFAPAFERALNSGRLAVLELRIDPECLGPGTRLSELGT